MTRPMRLVGLCALIYASGEALEFGQMGGISPAMGGAGVALEDSAWGLYYNPALLDMDTRKTIKIGISVGARASGHNLPSLVGATARDGVPFSIKNGLYMSTQDGVALQLRMDHKDKKTKVRKGLGAVGIGLFINAFGQAQSLKSSTNAMALKALGLGSLNVGYAKAFDFKKGGTLALGASVGYMYSMSLEASGQRFSKIRTLLSQKNLREKQSHFLLDLGMVYKIVGLSVGVVVKNVNKPTIRYKMGNMTKQAVIGPQARLGLAYRWRWLNLVADIDLTSNKTLAFDGYSRMVGGGIGFNFPFGLGLRFGAMGDIAKQQVLQQGVILTGGLRYTILNLVGIDLSVQSGLKRMGGNKALQGAVQEALYAQLVPATLKFPNYFSLRLGLNVEF
ncbi:conjugal transfer protein TraF [Helicobacter felis]|uniref:conjugal transfer protein TraF n=1 Tax=Helicobacter felis TaxID=214 RepID=UPI00131569DE|nr:conjugal transfer protein TraF [Helicobacter felis]